MKIKNMEKDGKKLEFDLEDSNPATANAIRRTATREIPSLAITEVDFFQNTSTMFDEYIAHRLGMVPLNTPKTYKLTEEGEPPSTILSLTANGPGTIKASQLEAEDPAVEVLYPETPIIKLTENQEIELEARAELRRGKNHARHKICFITYTTETDKEAEEDPETKFHFKLESYTGKEPENILTQTLELIKGKANELQEAIKEEK